MASSALPHELPALRRKAATDKLVEKIIKHDSWPIQPDIVNPPLLRLTSKKPLWVNLEPVDIKSRWRHNWKSAQVVNSHLMCDHTIHQPGFDLSQQQWSLQNEGGQLAPPGQDVEVPIVVDKLCANQLFFDPSQNLDLLQIQPISVELDGQQYSIIVCTENVFPSDAISLHRTVDDVAPSEPIVQAIAETESTSNNVSISVEPDQGEITCTARGRKRRRNVAEWKANKRQRLRQTGKQYTSIRGKVVEGKKVKAHKSNLCRFQCCENFTEADRQIIHNDFWILNDHEKCHYFARTTARVDSENTTRQA